MLIHMIFIISHASLMEFITLLGDDKLVLMSRELDPFFETELNPQEFGDGIWKLFKSWFKVMLLVPNAEFLSTESN